MAGVQVNSKSGPDSVRTGRIGSMASKGWVRLSARELQVLRSVAEGQVTEDIASRLCVSPRTVQFHLKNVFRKLRVRNRLEAINAAMALGIPGLGSGLVRPYRSVEEARLGGCSRD